MACCLREHAGKHVMQLKLQAGVKVHRHHRRNHSPLCAAHELTSSMLGTARVPRCSFVVVPSGWCCRLAWLDRRRMDSCSANAMRDAALSASCLCVLSPAVHKK